MKFRTQYTPKEPIFSEVGSGEKTQLKLNYDKKGCMKLVECGKIDLYSEIQSHADSVDLHVVLKRFANGDADALNIRQGAYGDFSACPSTFAGVLNSLKDAEKTFNGFSPEIRSLFNNSFAQFYAALDNPTIMEDIANATMKTREVEKKAEVAAETVPEA